MDPLYIVAGFDQDTAAKSLVLCDHDTVIAQERSSRSPAGG